MKAREIMTRCPDVVTPDDGILGVAESMHYGKDGCVPVVRDRQQRVLVGVITARDIVARCVARKHSNRCLVRDHMTPPPLYTVAPDDDIRDAARMMAEREIRRVPVVTSDGVLVGMLREADVWFGLQRAEPESRTAPHTTGTHAQLVQEERCFDFAT
jgi:CBS domain-containing protein